MGFRELGKNFSYSSPTPTPTPSHALLTHPAGSSRGRSDLVDTPKGEPGAWGRMTKDAANKAVGPWDARTLRPTVLTCCPEKWKRERHPTEEQGWHPHFGLHGKKKTMAEARDAVRLAPFAHSGAHSGTQTSENPEYQFQSRSLAFPSAWGALHIRLSISRRLSPSPLYFAFLPRPSEAKELSLACEWGVGGTGPDLVALGSIQCQEILRKPEQAMAPPSPAFVWDRPGFEGLP